MPEQEVKLAFTDVAAARRAIGESGASSTAPRRRLDDRLFDWPDRRLQLGGLTCRLRRDDQRAFLTFKGPLQPGPVKSREEIETSVGDADRAEAFLEALGLTCTFRSEKYREEYLLDSVSVALDETPVGVYVELEGVPAAIERVAHRLGRTPADYRLESYPRLYLDWCAAHGIRPGDMVFR